jgi:hypothetical protein
MVEYISDVTIVITTLTQTLCSIIKNKTSSIILYEFSTFFITKVCQRRMV